MLLSLDWIKEMFIKSKDKAGSVVGLKNMHNYEFGDFYFDFIDMGFGVIGVSFWNGDEIFNFDISGDYNEVIGELDAILG